MNGPAPAGGGLDNADEHATSEESGGPDVLGARYPARRILDLVGDKWTPVVLYCLSVQEVRRFNEFQRDLRGRRWNPHLFSLGCERILYGYAQIIVLGNWLVSVRLQQYIAGLDPSQAALIEYLECIAFGANIYFQFAGYSSVAIGFAMLLCFRVIENFDHPFIRPNISAFWRCWHISLSSWCRDYVYMVVVALTRKPASIRFASAFVSTRGT